MSSTLVQHCTYSIHIFGVNWVTWTNASVFSGIYKGRAAGALPTPKNKKNRSYLCQNTLWNAPFEALVFKIVRES